MARNVRNYWIEADVHGRKTRIATGPSAKDGGFACYISMRDHGAIARDVVTVCGRVDGEDLILEVWDTSGEYATQHIVHEVKTHR